MCACMYTFMLYVQFSYECVLHIYVCVYIYSYIQCKHIALSTKNLFVSSSEDLKYGIHSRYIAWADTVLLPMRICMFVYTYTHIYAYAYTYTQVEGYNNHFIRADTVLLPMYVYTYMHIYIYIYIHTHMHIHIHRFKDLITLHGLTLSCCPCVIEPSTQTASISDA
jgi:hypothetical protein